jgi:hypothetical protein
VGNNLNLYDVTAKLGTDPEFFITNTKGDAVPAHNYFKSKKEKTPLYPFGGEQIPIGQAFRDGYALELNVPPSTSPGWLAWSVSRCIQLLRTLLPEGLEISSHPTMLIDLETLNGAPEDVRMFGCDPSRDAYDGGEEKIFDLEATTYPLRHTGGHMHFSFNPNLGGVGKHPLCHRERQCELVQQFDQFIGLPLTYLYPGTATAQRRQYYGQAGEYRYQTYNDVCHGIEYRTPTPELFNNSAVATIFFDAGRNLQEALLRKEDAPPMADPAAVREAINSGMVDESLLRDFPGIYKVEELKLVRGLPTLAHINAPILTSVSSWNILVSNVRQLKQVA